MPTPPCNIMEWCLIKHRDNFALLQINQVNVLTVLQRHEELLHLADAFPTQNVMKQGDALLALLFNFALECAIRKYLNCMEHTSTCSVLMMIIY